MKTNNMSYLLLFSITNELHDWQGLIATILIGGIAGFLAQLLTPEATIVGSLVGNYNELVELLALTSRGAVTLTTTEFPLEGINDALDTLNNGRMIGRGMLIP